MPHRTRPKVPQYCRQHFRKRGDVAFAKIDGKRHYLGKYGSRESRERYQRIIARWLTGQDAQPRKVSVDGPTMAEVMAAYLRHVRRYYVTPAGEPTQTQNRIKQAMRGVKLTYRSTPACDFGPLALQTVRQHWIDAGLCRSTINERVADVRRMFKWAAAQQIVPGNVFRDLQTVDGLKYGRAGVPEAEPRRPVPEEHVDAVLPYLSRQVAAMVTIQRLSGARPSELCQMRPCDLDRSNSVWLFNPESHKNKWRRHERVIYLGPKCQAVIEPFLTRPPHKPLFSPAEAEAERRAELHAKRKTPLDQGNRPGTNRRTNPQRTLGEHYTRFSYRRAIERACTKANVPQWTPYQLRHSAATNLRRDYGIDVAATVLGHRLGSTVTEIYAQANVAKAVAVMQEIG